MGTIDTRKKKLIEAIKGMANVPTMYGKCKASFLGKDNVPQNLNDGTLSVHECDVTDYDGYKVFREVPED